MTADLPHPLRTLVPMKPLAEAKTRLWDDLPPSERQAAVLMMLQRVVAAAVSATARGACVVVGGDEVVREVAEASGARWTPDTADGLNPALWAAIQDACADGAEATLFLPGDLPLITDNDVVAVIAGSHGYAATVCVRASSDGGTNALLQPAATAFEPLLGERSFEKHCEAAVATGAALVTPDLPRVAFDLDTRADYEWAKQNVAWFTSSVYDWEAWLRGARKSPLPAPPTEQER
ncbi:MAG: 2-phospho-L-lactate guanylyltransferase [Chloroflexi bacterium]|nr:2-phospho-L-lactate guanylyltransferase [Chloroflexota bacterium]